MINCDSTGTQDMAVDMLRAELRKTTLQIPVKGYSFSVYKDQMYKNLAMMMLDKKDEEGKIIQKAKIKFPVAFGVEKEKFIKQFTDLQKEIKNNKWNCHHPEGATYHDDYPDSLALACMTFNLGEMPIMEYPMSFGNLM